MILALTTNKERLARIERIRQAIQFEIDLQKVIVDDHNLNRIKAQTAVDDLEQAESEHDDRPGTNEEVEAMADAQQTLADAEEMLSTEETFMSYLEAARDEILDFRNASNEDPV